MCHSKPWKNSWTHFKNTQWTCLNNKRFPILLCFNPFNVFLFPPPPCVCLEGFAHRPLSWRSSSGRRSSYPERCQPGRSDPAELSRTDSLGPCSGSVRSAESPRPSPALHKHPLKTIASLMYSAVRILKQKLFCVLHTCSFSSSLVENWSGCSSAPLAFSSVILCSKPLSVSSASARVCQNRIRQSSEQTLTEFFYSNMILAGLLLLV